ncbi:hypothetical protein FEI17_26840 (plasmid) [Kosakonia radicincitans]|uniref:hypothetical protein n=1 Tax=Kosakonia radicincitans TaxID=283686 RepID=UPI0011EF948E|nr:hypothetical protein [Kosakonia radicincitans]QEM94257.1 hypothetical protein FEI17_26840 [Kosakonia radicincitans]
MSLNNQDLAQKKVKSLRDLFGGSLTEEGKAILDRAADSAARDLTLAVFGPEDRPSIKVSDAGRREAVKCWVKYPEPSKAELVNLVVHMDNIIKSNDILKTKLSCLKEHGKKSSSAYDISSGDALPYHLINEFHYVSDNMKLVDITNVKEQDYEVSPFRGNNLSVRDLYVNRIKATIVAVHDELGKTGYAVFPMMLKPDNTKTLPKLVRNRRLTHKVK